MIVAWCHEDGGGDEMGARLRSNRFYVTTKGGAVVLTCWIEKMESVQEMSGCSVDQKVKYTAGSFMGKALMWWNSQICTLSREVAVSMSWNDFKFMMIEEFCPSHEMQKLEFELWNHAMVGAGHAAYTDRFHELVRLVPYLVTSESRMIERSTCPRLSRAQGPGGNHPNQVAANNGGQGRGNQRNQARGRACMLGAEEARQDPNIVTGHLCIETSDWRIMAAQKEAVDEFAGLQKGLDEMIEQRSDGNLYYLDRIWVPLKDEVRTLIIDEAHKSKYSMHPGALRFER
ncbi:putative reverse transcriptase domain-containing protein [Tanacetum coccineum]|uniref:Reverse transcriptase domain-containing protein n=1 Tax=Tanacetum coccineum TaxID=301880 RepID=A0ABQ5ADB6_9ASTR